MAAARAAAETMAAARAETVAVAQHPPAPAAPHLGSRTPSRPTALGALAALVFVCMALAVCFAVPGSNVVLATGGGSPDWLLGPWRVFGLDGADGPLGGPLFYLGLWLALLGYVLVLMNAGAIGPRLAIGSIVGLQLVFFLAPPLLSQDVFSYIAYARLDVVHSLNPYTHSPNDVPTDAAYGFAGSKNATSAYGPLFTIATYPLAKLGVSSAFWILKLVALLAGLGIVGLTWACARTLGRDPVPAAMFVGLNPLLLAHVIAGAHNDALMMAIVMAGVYALLRCRDALAGGAELIATGVKASAGLVTPFMFVGSERRGRLVVGGLAGAAIAVAASFAAFGSKAVDAFVLIGQNQERTSSWSLPQKAADGIAAVTGGDPRSIVHFTRAAFAVAFVAVLALLLRSAWRRRAEPGYWVAAAAWATLALLLATAWLVPWYVIWLLPLAALAGDRRLSAATVVLTAYMLVIAVPL